MNQPKRLSEREVSVYHERGFLKGYSIFDELGVERLRRGFEALMGRLAPGQRASDICDWEKKEPFLYQLATTPAVLDYVEDLIGPNILLWSTHFFCKEPGDGTVVAWHQDARYWPLWPHRAVTVWLAFDDSDRQNGALKVVPGTHSIGLLRHDAADRAESVLSMQITPGAFDESEAEHIELRAGEISLHDDNLVHGSDANTSERRRCGLTMRYMPPEVECDRSVWPAFSCRLVRGVDRFQHNVTW
ncbi:MAG TPA: phytanoyl-CoA dioxygenase family protein [Polyangiaceae bacterium]|jgi:ectoine hydroxylase-related dioxygenase (phytanoyl-CoA dioxygenase family)|nr:phytanoyl-CoA dioxygenase family protein [Polyangiaceae bacterium]